MLYFTSRGFSAILKMTPMGDDSGWGRPEHGGWVGGGEAGPCGIMV